jgi:hypothetical protein
LRFDAFEFLQPTSVCTNTAARINKKGPVTENKHKPIDGAKWPEKANNFKKYFIFWSYSNYS